MQTTTDLEAMRELLRACRGRSRPSSPRTTRSPSRSDLSEQFARPGRRVRQGHRLFEGRDCRGQAQAEASWSRRSSSGTHFYGPSPRRSPTARSRCSTRWRQPSTRCHPEPSIEDALPKRKGKPCWRRGGKVNIDYDRLKIDDRAPTSLRRARACPECGCVLRR